MTDLRFSSLVHALLPPSNMTENGSGQRHDRTALILYGSETGNSHDVAEDLGRVAERLHFLTRVSEMDSVEINALPNYSVVIFAISTTGQGEFPKNARKFWKSLLRKRLPPGCLNHVSFTSFGLGDSSYPKFNWAARKLHKRIEQLSGNEIYPRGEADDQHEEGIDGTFLSWLTDLRKRLLVLFPLPEGLNPIPNEVLLPPKVRVQHLQPVSQEQRTSSTSLHDDSSIAAHNHSSAKDEMKYIPEIVHAPVVCPQLRDHLRGAVDPVDSKLPPRDCIPIKDAFRVQLVENKRVTPADHWQDVRLLTLLMEKESEYEPGDTITIFPKNFPEDVQTLIDLMGWEDDADKPLCFEWTSPDGFESKHLLTLPTGIHPLKDTTLRQLLTHNLDITAIPKPFFFQYISHFSSDLTHKERLLEFSNAAYRDEYYDYATRPRRSMLEVLADFPSIKLSFQDVPSIFPAIRGREFSICSGGLGANVFRSEKLAKEPDRLHKVELLVAIVKYQTVLKKIRQGLCSRYIASLQPGTMLNVQLESKYSFYKTPCENPELPVIMIAAGTGVAPCRSLIWERAKTMTMREPYDEREPVGPNLLIYGGRNKAKDFFFKEEWATSILRTKVLTAFSRDQREKIYVQDVIRKEGKDLARLIIENNAVVFVCGSSGNMPKAVREALLDIMVLHGGKLPGLEIPRELAEARLVDMEKKGRYVQETW